MVSPLFVLLFILFSPLKIHFKRKMGRLPIFSTGEKAEEGYFYWIGRPLVPPAPSPLGTTPRLKERGAAPRYTVAAPLLCAYAIELVPLFLPLSSQFWSGKGSTIQDYPSPQALANRAFQEKPGLDRLLFSQFKSCIVHQILVPCALRGAGDFLSICIANHAVMCYPK